MAEYPPIRAPVAFPTGVSAQVTGAKAEISPDHRGLVLRLVMSDLDGEPIPEGQSKVALSFPAAVRLARLLDQAVETYLHGGDGE